MQVIIKDFLYFSEMYDQLSTSCTFIFKYFRQYLLLDDKMIQALIWSTGGYVCLRVFVIYFVWVGVYVAECVPVGVSGGYEK